MIRKFLPYPSEDGDRPLREQYVERRSCENERKIHFVKFLGWPEKFSDWVTNDALNKFQNEAQ